MSTQNLVIPALDPNLFDEIGTALASLSGPPPDRLVTAEAMGIPAGMALARHLDVPLTIARKRAYGLPGEPYLIVSAAG